MHVTIFTPTYNRATLLPRLFESLKRQDYKDFEWVIVDDGSQDNTESIIQAFKEEHHIQIIYEKQPNSGKHIAINKGVELANGELFFIVDSDDFLPTDSLEKIIKQYQKIKDNNKIAGIIGKRKLLNKNSNTQKLHKDYLICSPFDFRFKYHYQGDMAEAVKTEILKKYKFPHFEGEKFCTEALVWNRVGRDYHFLYFDEFIYDCEYQEDGLTSNYWQLLLKSPKGSLLYYKELLDLPLKNEDKKQALKAYNNIAKVNNISKLKIICEIGVMNFIKIYL